MTKKQTTKSKTKSSAAPKMKSSAAPETKFSAAPETKISAAPETKISAAPKTKSQIKDIKRIQEKAYYIWAEKGFPENTELDNWLEAERQLCN